jgi:hypothetical protein
VSQNPSRPTVSDDFNAQYEMAGISGTDTQTRNVNVDRDTTQSSQSQVTARNKRYRRLRTAIAQEKFANGKVTLAKGAIDAQTKSARRAVLRINRVAWWFLGGVAVIQFKLALLSTVFIALGATVVSLSESIIGRIFLSILNLTTSLLNESGLSLDVAFTPGLAIMFIITIIGIFQYIMMILIYYVSGSMVGVQPMSGQGSNIKLMSVVLGIIGYSFPLLNFIPWIYIYTFVVLRYPK